jgi:hypothetical protein
MNKLNSDNEPPKFVFQNRQDSLRSSEAFKDLARRDAEELMAEELEKLLATAPDKIKEVQNKYLFRSFANIK